MANVSVPLCPIEPGKIYPLPLFKQISGFGFTAMRTARRQGLRVRYLAGRAFVMGDDFLDYVKSLDSQGDEGSGE